MASNPGFMTLSLKHFDLPRIWLMKPEHKETMKMAHRYSTPLFTVPSKVWLFSWGGKYIRTVLLEVALEWPFLFFQLHSNLPVHECCLSSKLGEFAPTVVSLQPLVVGSWLLEQAGFLYLNVFQHWVIQSDFLLLHQSACVYWVSPIKYLSIKVILKHKMTWFDLTDFWEYPQKGQVRSEASWLFPTIYYCLLLYSTNSSSTGLIQTNQSENDNVFCLY